MLLTHTSLAFQARRGLIHTLSKHVARNGPPWISINKRSLSEAALAVRGIPTISPNTARKAFIPSAEQQSIVELCRTQNVVVSARPGAGKTATAEAIVAANPGKPIAIVTYSKRLQLETAQRMKDYPWSEVYTFHGLSSRLFNKNTLNDTVLRSLRKAGIAPVWTGAPYEIIILDELQDCTDDLFWLTSSFISAVTHAASGRAPRIVVLGDERQAIYDYKGADARYLSLAPSTMASLSPYPWTHLTLSKSFRLSHETSTFINKVFLGRQYITGSHSGPKPLYLHVDLFNAKALAEYLLPLIHKYGPEKTAILSPSISRNWPIVTLTNHLSENHGIPMAVNCFDKVQLVDSVVRGKMCVSTYHQFKGSERDLVVVYGADGSFYNYQGRALADDRCANGTFVALTRACKQLVVVNHNESPPMPFVDVEELYKTSKFVNLHNEDMLKCEPPGRPEKPGLLLPKVVYVSQVAMHISHEILEDICAKHLHIRKTPPLPRALHIDAPSEVVTDAVKGHCEPVIDLNGHAVVAAFEFAHRRKLRSLGIKKSFPKSAHNPREHAIWICRMASEYVAKNSGYKSRMIQMKNHPHDWLAQYLDAAKNRLKAALPEKPDDFLRFHTGFKFEVPMVDKGFCVQDPAGGDDQVTQLLGYGDIVLSTLSLSHEDDEGDTIWEVKFVSQLSDEHAIQAAMYGYLWATRSRNKGRRPPKIILFNVQNGEKWEIGPRRGVASLKAVVQETLLAKYTRENSQTTEEFLEKCAKAKAEVAEAFWKKYGQELEAEERLEEVVHELEARM